MIVDITNEVVNRIITDFPTVEVLTEYPQTQKKFPCIVITEMSNNADPFTKDTSGYKYSDVSIEVNIFTTGDTRMSKAKKLRNEIDVILSDEYGMLRAFSDRTPNVDTDIYRYTMRFNGLVNKDREIFRG